MSEEQVLANERMAEPETDPDDLTGRSTTTASSAAG